MYNISNEIFDESETIRADIDICIVHAEALKTYYTNVLQDLKITPDHFKKGKLKDSCIELIFDYRKEILGIPISQSREARTDARLILAAVSVLRAQCEQELRMVAAIHEQMSKNKATCINVTLLYNQLQLHIDMHCLKVNYMLASEGAVLTASGKTQEVATITHTAYKRLVKKNAASVFLADTADILKRHVGDLQEQYARTVACKIKNVSNDPGIIVHDVGMVSVDFSWLLDPFKSKFAIFNEYVADLRKTCDVLPSEDFANYLARAEKEYDIETVQKSADYLASFVEQYDINLVLKNARLILGFLVTTMKKDDMLSKDLPMLKQRLEDIKNLMLCRAAIQASSKSEALELKSETAVITPAAVLPMQAVIKSNDASVTPVKIDKPKNNPGTSAEENKAKIKTLDLTVLAMFFTTPVPHKIMKQDAFYKFMLSIGATIDNKMGNGSSVKITLDPKSILIAPGGDLVSSSMPYHVPHQKGHSDKTIPSYIIKAAVQCFERAGIYDYLHAQYKEYLATYARPNAKQKNKIS